MTALKFGALLALGLAFAGMGVWTLYTRKRDDMVPLAELLINRALGEEPPPRNAWDRRLALFHGGMSILFGLLMSVVGAVGLALGDAQ